MKKTVFITTTTALTQNLLPKDVIKTEEEDLYTLSLTRGLEHSTTSGFDDLMGSLPDPAARRSIGVTFSMPMLAKDLSLQTRVRILERSQSLLACVALNSKMYPDRRLVIELIPPVDVTLTLAEVDSFAAWVDSRFQKKAELLYACEEVRYRANGVGVYCGHEDRRDPKTINLLSGLSESLDAMFHVVHTMKWLGGLDGFGEKPRAASAHDSVIF